MTTPSVALLASGRRGANDLEQRASNGDAQGMLSARGSSHGRHRRASARGRPRAFGWLISASAASERRAAKRRADALQLGTTCIRKSVFFHKNAGQISMTENVLHFGDGK